MKNYKNYLIVLAITGLSFGITQLSTAQPGPGKNLNRCAFQGRGAGQDFGARYQWIPDMSAEQMEQMKELRIAHLKDVQPLKSELKINKAKLDALMIEEEPDMKGINQLIDESGKLKTDLQKKSAAHKLEIRKLLTDDQKVFLDTHKGHRKQGFPNANRRQGRF